MAEITEQDIAKDEAFSREQANQYNQKQLTASSSQNQARYNSYVVYYNNKINALNEIRQKLKEGYVIDRADALEYADRYAEGFQQKASEVLSRMQRGEERLALKSQQERQQQETELRQQQAQLQVQQKSPQEIQQEKDLAQARAKEVLYGSIFKQEGKTQQQKILEQSIQAKQKTTLPTIYNKDTGETYRGVPQLQLTTRTSYGIERPSTEYEREYVNANKVLQASTREDIPKETFARATSYVTEQRSKQLTETQRKKGVSNLSTTAKGIGTGLAISAVGTTKFVQSAITEPVKTIKSIPKGIKETARFVTSGELANVLRQEPAFATGYITGEYLTAKGIGKGSSLISRELGLLKTRVSPKYRPVIFEEGDEIIKGIPSEFKDTGKIDISISKDLGQISTPLKEQAKLIGKNVDAVSAQRSLFKLFEEEKSINKPIPGEELLKESTKKRIKTLSPKDISSKEISELNKAVIEESKSKGLLEKSFFADPYGKLRVSRLGILEKQKEASFLDVLSGDVTFKKTKPQAILFENIQVERLPKNIDTIRKKLLRSESITPIEEAKLLKFQLTPSGKFKPIGFISKEPEISLAPGELIVKKGVKAKTIYARRSIDIISAEIKQPQPLKIVPDELLKKDESYLLNNKLKKYGKKSSSEIQLKPYYSPSKPLSRLTSLKTEGLLNQKDYLMKESKYYNSGIYKEPVSKGFISPIKKSTPYLQSSQLSKTYKPLSYSSISYEPISSNKYNKQLYAKSPYKNIYKELKYSPYKYKTTSKQIKYKYTTPILKTRQPLIKEPTYKGSESYLTKGSGAGSFEVFKIVKKKPVFVSGGLTKEMALDIGTSASLKDLTATFGIRKSKAPLRRGVQTSGEFSRYRDLFREPALKSKYRKYGNVFVQRERKVSGLGTGRLTFAGEKRQILESKRRKEQDIINSLR